MIPTATEMKNPFMKILSALLDLHRNRADQNGNKDESEKLTSTETDNCDDQSLPTSRDEDNDLLLRSLRQRQWDGGWGADNSDCDGNAMGLIDASVKSEVSSPLPHELYKRSSENFVNEINASSLEASSLMIYRQSSENFSSIGDFVDRGDAHFGVASPSKMYRKPCTMDFSTEKEANGADEEMRFDMESNTWPKRGTVKSTIVNAVNAPTSRTRKTESRPSTRPYTDCEPGSGPDCGQEEVASGIEEAVMMHDKDEIPLTNVVQEKCAVDLDGIPTRISSADNAPVVHSVFNTNIYKTKTIDMGRNNWPNTSAANTGFVHVQRAPTRTIGNSGNITGGCFHPSIGLLSVVSSTGPGSGPPNAGPFTTSHNISSTGVNNDKKYPQDCYSFLAIHGPKEPIFFFFGLIPFIFQLLFLALLLWSATNEKSGTVGDVDNPSTGIFMFVPANASPIVRCTQLLSLASYVIFPDSSVRDIVKAIQNYPISSKVQIGNPIGCMRLSCVLKFTQAFLAILATLLLIVTSNKVVDIILILTALNFISYFDDNAFNLAMTGEFGPTLETESKRIANTELPPCMYKDNSSRQTCNVAVKALIFLILFAIMISVIVAQNTNTIWVTELLRVQFQDGTGLEGYSGCFGISDYSRFLSSSSQRRSYDSFDEDNSKASFGYCKDYNQWVLFKDEGDNLDPCEANKKERELARSSKTDSFDISTSFDEPWVSSSGSPLDMFFFDTEKEKYCNLKLGDSICNEEFNELGYQYDGGDCCADTCIGSLCGIGGLPNAFGVSNNISADGFPLCVGSDVVPITIHLNDIRSSRDSELLWFEDVWDSDEWNGIEESEWREETPENPYFSLDCNGKNILTVYIEKEMVGEAETVWVQDGANCTLLSRNTERNSTGLVSIDQAFDVDPILVIDYTVSYVHGEKGDEVEILSQHSKDKERKNFKLIPTCFFRKLETHVDFEFAYTASGPSNEAIKWLVENEETVECEDEKFIERYAVTKMFFDMNVTDQLHKKEKQCTWPSIVCRGGHVDSIKVKGSPPKKSISSEIGLFSNLQELTLNKNNIITIPSEIGLLKKLNAFDLASNQIKIFPSEIGLLTGLQKLQLEYNDFTVIPTEIFLLKNLLELHLDSNLITAVPTELGLFTSLQKLSLVSPVEGNKTIKPIPSEIGLLTNLEILFLDKNHFNRIPSEVGLLTNLKILYLRNNFITNIPTEIRFLTSLEVLELSHNQLTKIPSEIGFMTSIKSIDLANNQLTKIPSEIGFLASLKNIDFANNQLRKIPSEMGVLTSLQKIESDGNYLTCDDYPKEVEYLCLTLYPQLPTSMHPSEETTSLRTSFAPTTSYLELKGLSNTSSTGPTIRSSESVSDFVTTAPLNRPSESLYHIMSSAPMSAIPTNFPPQYPIEIPSLTPSGSPNGSINEAPCDTQIHNIFCRTTPDLLTSVSTISPTSEPSIVSTYSPMLIRPSMPTPSRTPRSTKSPILTPFPSVFSSTSPSTSTSSKDSSTPSISHSPTTASPSTSTSSKDSSNPTTFQSDFPSSAFSSTSPSTSTESKDSSTPSPLISRSFTTASPSTSTSSKDSSNPTTFQSDFPSSAFSSTSTSTSTESKDSSTPSTSPSPLISSSFTTASSPISTRANDCTEIFLEVGEKATKLKKNARGLDCFPTEIGLFPNLEVIKLGSNKISSIPTEIGLLTDLQFIKLSFNKIEVIPTEIGLLTTLTDLLFDGNIIDVIPTEIGLLTSLTDLDFGYNEIEVIPTEIGLLTSLTDLDFDGNIINVIPTEIGLLTRLTDLYFGDNEIEVIPMEIGLLTTLTDLDFGDNEIEVIPTEIGLLTNLKYHLDFGDNEIEVIPTDIGLLTKSKALYFGCNEIEVIPKEIGLLTNLKYIYFGDNKLEVIPTEIGLLTNLKYIYFGENKIEVIPTEIGVLTNLADLDFGDNEIEVIPTEIGLLTKLKSLYIDSNIIDEIPTEIGLLTSLTDLYFGDNEIEVIPIEIGLLTKLKSLHFGDNEIEVIPTEIGLLTSLTDLYFGDNEIEVILTEIGFLTSLIALDFGYNEIEVIPTEIGLLTSLHYLHFGDNEIEVIPTEIGLLTNLETSNTLVR